MSHALEDPADEPPSKRIKLEEDVVTLSLPPVARLPRGRKPKKTSEQRALELLQDARLCAVEPQQVLCRMCGCWIKLFKHTDYAAANWRVHAEKCAIKTKWLARVKEEPNDTFELTTAATADNVAVSVKEEPCSSRRPVRSLEERKQALLKDRNAANPEPHRVFCLICKSWVKLHNTREYDLFNWLRHIEKCNEKFTTRSRRRTRGSSPSQRKPLILVLRPKVEDHDVVVPGAPPNIPDTTGVKKRKGRNAEERLKAFKDDPRCGEILPAAALCNGCEKWIKLNRDVPYVDSNWHRHTSRCTGNKTWTNLTTDVDEDTKPVIMDAATESARGESTRNLRGSSGRCAEQRANELRRDSRLGKVEPHRVFCNLCNTWLRLQTQREYDSWNWRKHIELCERRHSATEPQAEADAATTMVDPGPPPPQMEIMETAPFEAPKRRTKEERKHGLLTDPRCEKVQPYHVTCKMCKRTIGLHAKKEWFISNWLRHADVCEVKTQWRRPVDEAENAENDDVALDTEPAVKQQLEEEPEQKIKGNLPKRRVTLIVEDKSERKADAPSPAKTSAPRKSVEERKAQLKNDPRVGDVEPNRVFCNVCKRWLKLNNEIEYATFNWYKHIAKCAVKVEKPSDHMKVMSPEIQLLDAPPPQLQPVTRRLRTTAREREVKLRQDPRLMLVEAHRALCGMCGHWLKLQNKIEYDPHNWISHAVKCQAKTGWDPSTSGVVMVPTTSGDDLATKAESSTDIAYTHETGEILQLHPSSSPKRSATIAIIKQEPLESKPITNGGKFNFISNKNIRKNDAQREASLRADPRAAAVERGKVLCKMCSTWIRLNSTTAYLPGNWLRHAERCQSRTRWKVNADTKQEPVVQDIIMAIEAEYEEDEIVDEVEAGSAGPAVFGYVELGHLVSAYEPSYSSTSITVPPLPESTLTPPPSHLKSLSFDSPKAGRMHSHHTHSASMSMSRKRLHRSTEDRRLELEADPRSKAVESDRVLCAICDRWIQLRRDVAYSGQNWLKHAGICSAKNSWNPPSTDQREAGEFYSSPLDILASACAAVEASSLLVPSPTATLVQGPKTPVKQKDVEDSALLPYSATRAKAQRFIDATAPVFKPVTWDLCADGDDDAEGSDVEEDDDGDDRADEQNGGAKIPHTEPAEPLQVGLPVSAQISLEPFE